MLVCQLSIISAAHAGAHYVQIAAYEGPGRSSSQYKFPNGNYPHTVISSTQLAWLEAGLASVNREQDTLAHSSDAPAIVSLMLPANAGTSLFSLPFCLLLAVP